MEYSRDKSTAFFKTRSLHCGDHILSLENPVVMGILNITPDSFFDGGCYFDEEQYLARAGQMLEEGAAILDIGAVSTRPGAADVSPEEEMRRMIPAVRAIAKNS
jgi:dihydropteroate synthase